MLRRLAYLLVLLPILGACQTMKIEDFKGTTPRLVLDDSGLTCGKFYPNDNIYKAAPAIRSIVLTVLQDGKVKEKVVSLGWSSREDYRTIVQLLGERFQREVPK